MFVGLNRRWRIYRYDSLGNETFEPHIDAAFPPSGLSEDGSTLIWDSSDPEREVIISRLTVLMYLNDDFVGGETTFFRPGMASMHGHQSAVIASVKPVTGSFLIFPQAIGDGEDWAYHHWPQHEASPVLSGSPKYIIRSDALFATVRSSNLGRRIVLRSPVFGDLYRIQMPSETENVTAPIIRMGIPTLAAVANATVNPRIFETKSKPQVRGIEGLLNQGPAFVLDNVIPRDVCKKLIYDFDQISFGRTHNGINFHSLLQILVSPQLAEELARKLKPHINVSEVEALVREQQEEVVSLSFAGLNRRWRIYRYEPSGNETFGPHIDVAFPPSGLSEDGARLVWDTSDPSGQQVLSRLSIIMYLNEDFVGGETVFSRPKSSPNRVANGQAQPSVIAAVRPVAGSCLIFPQAAGREAEEYAWQHWPRHEGSRVFSGNAKYVIRSDILFAAKKERRFSKG